MAAIVVTGAKGQLGMELRDLSTSYAGYDFLFTDIDALDITESDAVKRYIERRSPSWIINCASYTAVDEAENDRERAFAVNAGGVANIASAIKGSNCRLIHLSTDYVFDGTSNIPLTENDTPNPRTIYGKSKLEGEREALNHPFTMVVRTSWLYSRYGNNFVKTMLKIMSGGDNPKVVIDQTGSPTWARGLAIFLIGVVSDAIKNRRPMIPGIYNYSDEGVASWYDIAVAIASKCHPEREVTPCLTSDFSGKAERPAYTLLYKKKVKESFDITIHHWRESLVAMLKSYGYD